MPELLLCRQSFKQERFLSDHLQAGSLTDESATPVLSRIQDARFKRMVKPGDVVEISVSLGEKMGQFFSMTGEVRKARSHSPYPMLSRWFVKIHKSELS